MLLTAHPSLPRRTGDFLFQPSYYIYPQFFSELLTGNIPRVTSNEISWSFPDFFLTKSQFLLTFCSMKIWYFDLRRNSHGSHRCKKKIIAAIIWQKKVWFVIWCVVPIKSWHNLQNVKYYGNTFPNFLASVVGNCETEQPHHDIDSQNLKWGLHSDNNSISPDFCWISKCPDILRFPDIFLTF